MANNVPIHNALTIELANKLEDPLTVGGDDGITASTDGQFTTAKALNSLLNNAYKWVANLMVQKLGVPKTLDKSQGLRALQVFSVSTSGNYLNKDFLQELKLIVGANEFKEYPKYVLDGDLNSLISYGYAIEGGKVYVYRRVSGTLGIQAGDIASLYYIGIPRIGIGAVASISLTAPGEANVPTATMTFTAPTTGNTATGTCTITLFNGNPVSVGTVTLVTPGNGYTSAPSVSFSAGVTGATVAVTMTDITPGAGITYNTAPDVNLDIQWLELAMLHAAYTFCMDKTEERWVAMAATFQKQLDRHLGLLFQ